MLGGGGGFTHQNGLVGEILKISITRRVQNNRELMMGRVNVAKLKLILWSVSEGITVSEIVYFFYWLIGQICIHVIDWMDWFPTDSSDLHPAVSSVHVLVAYFQFVATLVHQVLNALQECVVIICAARKTKVNH